MRLLPNFQEALPFNVTVHCRNMSRPAAGSRTDRACGSRLEKVAELGGRVAVVTEEGAWIGLAIATALAAFGSRVLMTDFDRAAVKEAATWLQANGGMVESVELDFRNEGAVEQAHNRPSIVSERCI
jgi:hypothetical protein